MGEQHALVDDGARRHRRDIETPAVAKLERLYRVPGLLADDVELALERVLVERVRAAADEHLTHHRLDFLGALGQARVIGRHVAPAEKHLALAGDRTLDFLLAGHARGRLLGQKNHADAVLPHRRQRQALSSAGAPEKRIGQLNQDARTVALQRIGARCTPMGQILRICSA